MTPAAATDDALIEELYRSEGKAEIRNGMLVREEATGDAPSRAGGFIFVSLLLHERTAGGGIAYPDNIGYLVNLPNLRSFSPDASFFTGQRAGMRFLDGAPVFAAEVRSESDYGPAAEQAMEEKRRDYFAAGTLVVWDVDLLGPDTVRKFAAPDAATAAAIFRRGRRDLPPRRSGRRRTDRPRLGDAGGRPVPLNTRQKTT